MLILTTTSEITHISSTLDCENEIVVMGRLHSKFAKGNNQKSLDILIHIL